MGAFKRRTTEGTMKPERMVAKMGRFLLPTFLVGSFAACAVPVKYDVIEGSLTVTAIASSEVSSEYSADKAIDSDEGTQWRSRPEANPWIVISLRDTYSITGVRLDWGEYYATDYEIQTSMDASAWTTIATLSSQNGETDDISELHGTGKFVRINITGRSNNSDGVYLKEIAVFGTVIYNPKSTTWPNSAPSTATTSTSDASAPAIDTASTSDAGVSREADRSSGLGAASSSIAPDAGKAQDAASSSTPSDAEVNRDADNNSTTSDAAADQDTGGSFAPSDAAANQDTGSSSDAGVPTGLMLPPVNAELDYQLGGAYTPANSVQIVSRDRKDQPAPGLYNICYVNGFQAQPDENDFWLSEQPDLVLRDTAGNPVIDQDWGEMLLDIRTEPKRVRLAEIVGGFIKGCASAGFVAVEVDNLDSYSRSGGRIKPDEAVAFIKLLSAVAHERGLAIAQKNSSELVGRRVEMGTDFAVAESCNRYSECDTYRDAYGDHVLIIEYRRSDFDKGCGEYPGLSIVLRDVNLVPSGNAAYVFDGC
jgi:hypothetical protein